MSELVIAKPEDGSINTIKILSIVSFILVFFALTAAIVIDVILYMNAIMTVIVGLIVSFATFFIAFVLMLFSIVLVFGVYLLDNYGFWPLTWARETFHSIVGSITFTPSQVMTLYISRMALLLLCIAVFIMCIISLTMQKQRKKKGLPKAAKISKPFSVVALIFAILGIFAQLGGLLLANFIV